MDPLQRALIGESQVAQLCKHSLFKAIDAADIVMYM